MNPENGGQPLETGKELSRRIESTVRLPAGILANEAAKAVLCTLAAHLTRGEAEHLLASLPENLKPLLEGYLTRRSEEHGMSFDRDQFLRILSERLRVGTETAESLARVVFDAIQEWIPEKEFRDIDSQLSTDLKRLWRAA